MTTRGNLLGSYTDEILVVETVVILHIYIWNHVYGNFSLPVVLVLYTLSNLGPTTSQMHMAMQACHVSILC